MRRKIIRAIDWIDNVGRLIKVCAIGGALCCCILAIGHSIYEGITVENLVMWRHVLSTVIQCSEYVVIGIAAYAFGELVDSVVQIKWMMEDME